MTTPARTIALHALVRWEEGTAHLEDILEEALQQHPHLERRERGLAWQIAVGVVRHRALLDHCLLACMQHPLAASQLLVWSALRSALFQVLFLRVPAHAALYESVNLIKNSRYSAKAGFANAVLRNASRQPPPTPPGEEAPLKDLATYYAYPLWLVERWAKSLSRPQLVQRLQGGNQIAPLTVQVNSALQNREQLMAKWQQQEIACLPGPHNPHAILLPDNPFFPALPGYNQGWFAAQDQAAQLVVPLLSPAVGDRVLDACAAPGGKSAQLLAITGVQVTVVEKEPERMALLQNNLSRLKLQTAGRPLCFTGDVMVPTLLPRVTFNKILLDAPCSATGVIRRHPEIKWRLQPEAIAQLARRQLQLLTAVARRMEKGGTLVYATCSLEEEENQQVIQAFLDRHSNWRIHPITPDQLSPTLLTPQGFMRIEPGQDNMDGHFAARLVRVS
ncbi:MAG: 16S rRNA (cytosine(967)-C(5))-methyltransferase RsmB [Magnetococcales bacterium]|nr:16S rRNA (cytosine(967)-C(5))-methyltransferase RsmB [Magnetococcales bacterium]